MTTENRRKSLLQRAAGKVIAVYQHWSRARPPSCRYAPSCSEYTRQAIDTHGAVKGGGMGLRRLLRCHPFGSSGYDPVPALKTRKRRQQIKAEVSVDV